LWLVVAVGVEEEVAGVLGDDPDVQVADGHEHGCACLNVGEHAFGAAVAGHRGVQVGDDVAGFEQCAGRASDEQSGVVVDDVDDLTSVPFASGQWVMSACQHSLGRSASKRRHDERAVCALAG
jgi:hypothetical protein